MVIIVWIMYVIQGILVPFLFSILLAIALHPLASLMEKWGVPRVLSAILCVILAIALLSGLVWFIVDQVIQIGSGSFNLAEKVNQIWSTIERFLTQTFGLEPTDLWNQIRESSMQLVTNTSTYLTAFFGSAGNTIAN